MSEVLQKVDGNGRQKERHKWKHEIRASRRKKGNTNIQDCPATDNTSKRRSREESTDSAARQIRHRKRSWISYPSLIKHDQKSLYTEMHQLDFASNPEMEKQALSIDPKTRHQRFIVGHQRSLKNALWHRIQGQGGYESQPPPNQATSLDCHCQPP